MASWLDFFGGPPAASGNFGDPKGLNGLTPDPDPVNNAHPNWGNFMGGGAGGSAAGGWSPGGSASQGWQGTLDNRWNDYNARFGIPQWTPNDPANGGPTYPNGGVPTSPKPPPTGPVPVTPFSPHKPTDPNGNPLPGNVPTGMLPGDKNPINVYSPWPTGQGFDANKPSSGAGFGQQPNNTTNITYNNGKPNGMGGLFGGGAGPSSSYAGGSQPGNPGMASMFSPKGGIGANGGPATAVLGGGGKPGTRTTHNFVNNQYSQSGAVRPQDTIQMFSRLNPTVQAQVLQDMGMSPQQVQQYVTQINQNRGLRQDSPAIVGQWNQLFGNNINMDQLAGHIFSNSVHPADADHNYRNYGAIGYTPGEGLTSNPAAGQIGEPNHRGMRGLQPYAGLIASVLGSFVGMPYLGMMVNGGQRLLGKGAPDQGGGASMGSGFPGANGVTAPQVPNDPSGGFGSGSGIMGGGMGGGGSGYMQPKPQPGGGGFGYGQQKPMGIPPMGLGGLMRFGGKGGIDDEGNPSPEDPSRVLDGASSGASEQTGGQTGGLDPDGNPSQYENPPGYDPYKPNDSGGNGGGASGGLPSWLQQLLGQSGNILGAGMDGYNNNNTIQEYERLINQFMDRGDYNQQYRPDQLAHYNDLIMNPDSALQSPGYQALRQRRQDNISRNFAGRGMSLSGNEMGELNQQGIEQDYQHINEERNQARQAAGLGSPDAMARAGMVSLPSLFQAITNRNGTNQSNIENLLRGIGLGRSGNGSGGNAGGLGGGGNSSMPAWLRQLLGGGSGGGDGSETGFTDGSLDPSGSNIPDYTNDLPPDIPYIPDYTNDLPPDMFGQDAADIFSWFFG